jgi:hypothetical protein
MARTTTTQHPKDQPAAAPLPIEYRGIDTRSADGNYATRSNIVPPKPGLS